MNPLCPRPQDGQPATPNIDLREEALTGTTRPSGYDRQGRAEHSIGRPLSLCR